MTTPATGPVRVTAPPSPAAAARAASETRRAKALELGAKGNRRTPAESEQLIAVLTEELAATRAELDKLRRP